MVDGDRARHRFDRRVKCAGGYGAERPQHILITPGPLTRVSIMTASERLKYSALMGSMVLSGVDTSGKLRPRHDMSSRSLDETQHWRGYVRVDVDAGRASEFHHGCRAAIFLEDALAAYLNEQ